jgi:hypothetical protein
VITKFEYEVLTKFFQIEDKDSKTTKYDFPKICIELERWKKFLKYRNPFFQNIQTMIEKKGLTIESYLEKLMKKTGKEKIDISTVKSIMAEVDIPLDYAGDSKMVVMLNEGKDAKSIGVEKFKELYLEVTKDTGSDLEDELTEKMLSQKKKHWSHLYLLNLSKGVKKDGFKNIKELAEKEYKMDERGFTTSENFTKMLRKLDPAFTTDDITKFMNEYKHSRYPKYSVGRLHKMMKFANELENKETAGITKDHIQHKGNSDVKEVLQTWAKHCRNRKFTVKNKGKHTSAICSVRMIQTTVGRSSTKFSSNYAKRAGSWSSKISKRLYPLGTEPKSEESRKWE